MKEKIKKTATGRTYLADGNGKRISRFYKEIGEFKNGLAIVTLNRKITKMFYLEGELKKEIEIYPKGVINLEGKEILSPIYESLHIADDTIRFAIGEKWGYADLTGKVICEPKYYFIEKFIDGVARVSDKKTWGLINFEGKLIVPMKYTYLGELRNGKRVARDLFDTYGAIDDSNNVVVPFNYDKVQLYGGQVVLMNTQKRKVCSV